MSETFSLLLPAFIAGIMTFLAPCTFPLVPGYIGFISGSSAKELKDPKKYPQAHKRAVKNGFMYVLGFSLVFILLGSIFGAFGSLLFQYRPLLTKIGGACIIFFGLFMMHVFDSKHLAFLNQTKRFAFPNVLRPGHPSSSFIFGMTFAFGWTPCIGPILGTILLLASTSGTVLQGILLLFVFSLGLGIPFLLIAWGIGKAGVYIQKMSKYLNWISFLGGALLVLIGILLLTDNMVYWVAQFQGIFGFREGKLLDYL